MPLTLISHFYNEEFLLPYWLRHHVPMFDHGVLIDYASTDNSVAIIRELAPNWEVRPSHNQWFSAREVDAEVMHVEAMFAGWKIALNTTEFLLCHDLPLYVRWMEKYRTDVRGIWSWDVTLVDRLEERDDPVTQAPLHFQKRWGYFDNGGEHSRILHHEKDGQYHVGRHHSNIVSKIIDDGLFTVWLGWSPMRYITERKLQIKTKIPQTDKDARMGHQHALTADEMEHRYLDRAGKAYDLWERHPNYREMIEYLANRNGLTAHGRG
jgi:hypothetical protein